MHHLAIGFYGFLQSTISLIDCSDFAYLGLVWNSCTKECYWQRLAKKIQERSG
jgi:hypothetical protein